MTYAEKLKDPRWQKKRLHILEKRSWMCQYCKREDKTLHVHHIEYTDEPWEAKDYQLVVLCEDCHNDEHKNKEQRERTEKELIGLLCLYLPHEMLYKMYYNLANYPWLFGTVTDDKWITKIQIDMDEDKDNV